MSDDIARDLGRSIAHTAYGYIAGGLVAFALLAGGCSIKEPIPPESTLDVRAYPYTIEVEHVEIDGLDCILASGYKIAGLTCDWTPPIPQCAEDVVLVGGGDFDDGRWQWYECGPALDSYDIMETP